MQIEIPDTFDEFLAGRRVNALSKPGGDTAPFKKIHTELSRVDTESSQLKKSSQTSHEFRKINPSRKRAYELENDQIMSQLNLASDSFIFGLNFYALTS